MAPARPRPVDATTATILVIDDDAWMRELLQLHLSNAGYRVQAAADGLEGGKAMLASPPALVIADIRMPYLDGIELVRAMRDDPRTAGVPVILLSSLQDDRVQDDVKGLGVAAFLAKPLQREALLSTVATALGAASAA